MNTSKMNSLLAAVLGTLFFLQALNWLKESAMYGLTAITGVAFVWALITGVVTYWGLKTFLIGESLPKAMKVRAVATAPARRKMAKKTKKVSKSKRK